MIYPSPQIVIYPFTDKVCLITIKKVIAVSVTLRLL